VPKDKLSPTEQRLLDALVSRRGAVASHGELLAEVWGLPADSPTRRLYATIERLRKKIERDPRHPQQLLTIGREGYAFAAARPSDPAPVSAAVSAPPSRLVGRAGLLEEGRRALADGHVVVLTGPAGVGKTALARELAPDGWWVDVSGATDSEELLFAVASALCLPVRGGDPSREWLRVARVAARRGVLVLDGAERCTEAVVEALEAWASTGLSVVVTSQRRIEAPASASLQVGPLPPEEAVELFLWRGLDGAAGSASGREALRRLVEHLDGLPLAIELAARWSRLATPEALWARAEAGRLPLSASASEGRSPRHRSLAAALRWSWEGLTAAQQRALAALSLAEGGVATTDLEALLGDDALELVDALAERSLVRGDGERIEVLGTVARFVADEVAARPEWAAPLWARHAACYAPHGRPERLRARRLDGANGMLALVPELGNLALAMRHGEGEDAVLAAVAWAEVKRALGAHAVVVEALEEVAARPHGAGAHRARLWMELGVARRYAGNLPGALAAFGEAEAGLDEALRADLDKALGTAWSYHGDAEAARAHLEAACRAYADRGDRYGQGLAEAELATLAMRAGRMSEAVDQLQRALGWLRGVGARFAESVYLGNLGVLQMKLGRFAAARATYGQALQGHRELGSSRFEALTLSNLGLLSALEGDGDAAIAHYRRVIELAAFDGDERDVAIARGNLAWSLLGSGELVEARRQLDLACDVFASAQLPYPSTDAALTRAWLCRAEGDLDGAQASLEQAESLIETHGFEEHAPSLAAQQGLLAAARGDQERAAAWLVEAEGAARSAGLSEGWDGAVYLAQLRAVCHAG